MAESQILKPQGLGRAVGELVLSPALLGEEHGPTSREGKLTMCIKMKTLSSPALSQPLPGIYPLISLTRVQTKCACTQLFPVASGFDHRELETFQTSSGNPFQV